MASLDNEPGINGGQHQSHRQQPSSHDTQTNGTQSLDSDLLSDPSRLISLILNGVDNHGISSSRRRERQRVYSHLSPEELLNALIDKEYEAKRLTRALRASLQRINSQTTRISELERDSQEALQRLRQINESRVQAQQQASSAEQELQLYRTELESARRELVRGRDMIRILRQQRDEAEQAAIRARAKARRLRQQRLVDAAREEGRRWGFHDGFERARQGLAMDRSLEGPLPGNVMPLFIGNMQRQYVDEEEGTASVHSSSSEVLQQTEVRPPSARSESIITPMAPWSLGHPRRRSSSAPSSQHQRAEAPPQAAPSRSAPPQPAPQVDEPAVSQPDAQADPVDADIKTPAVSVFQVDFADAPQELNNGRDPHSDKPRRRSWATATQHNLLRGPLPFQRKSDPRLGPPPEQAGPSNAAAHQKLPSPQDEKKKSSWYRTFSFRKKFGKRRVIDPDPMEKVPTGAEGPGDDTDEEEMYQHQREPSMSWYQPKGSSLRFRSSSVGSASTSTHMSQLPLVNTPTEPFSGEVNGSNPSLPGRVPKDAGMVKKLKEKESLLSVIKEDPMSRENTPITERTFGINKPKNSGIAHVASSSTMNSQALGGPLHAIAAAFSDSRYPQFPSTAHRRSSSDVVPPIAIRVQTPSLSQPSSGPGPPRVEEDLPNRFLSPNSTSRPLASVRRFSAEGDASSSRSAARAADQGPSRQTSAMNIKERYLARAAAEETESSDSPTGSSRMRELPERAALRPSRAGLAPTAVVPGTPRSPNRQALNHQMSEYSMKSLGSYAKFDPDKYVDPAFFEPNARPSSVPPDVPSRPASSASHLSYVTEKR